MGWQFAAAEFIGGPIMIVLLALTGGVRAARPAGRSGHGRGSSATPVASTMHDELERTPWREKLTSRAGWSDAAGLHDRRHHDAAEGARDRLRASPASSTVLVPMHVWNAVFLEGHGFWTSLENVLVGPFIAFISFVCSIGNVPMAAALWHGGISFGGVISFIFADLIALPLLLIYRKYYGTRLTLRLFVLVLRRDGAPPASSVEGLFASFGAIPTSRPETDRHDALRSGTTRRSSTSRSSACSRSSTGCTATATRPVARPRYAIDPVCGMQVEKANAPAHVVHDGNDVWFCSDRCRERYERAIFFLTLPAERGSQQEIQHLADGALADGGFGEREVVLNDVAVAATVAFLHDVPGGREIGHDPVRAALGDVQRRRDVPQPYARIGRDAQQHPGVVRQEAPLRHPERC